MSNSLMIDQPVLGKRAKKLKIAVWIVSFVVLGLVVAMRSPYKIPVSWEVELQIKKLPGVIALLNTLVAACLLGGLWCILRKKRKAHQRFMTLALILSSVFLLCYVAYHFTMPETKFGDVDKDGQLAPDEIADVGSTRYLYLGILLTHIVVAAVSFPIILMTFVHAWTGDFEKHRKLARKVFPLWLFVAVTGPICYWMLKRYY